MSKAATPSCAHDGEAEAPSSTSNNHEYVDTTFLVIGAGPAGASLGCFLASYGLKGIVVAAAPGTAREPRAHITNAAALECLRAIGLEDEVKKHATPGEYMQHSRWCRSMAGEEYARIYSWGNQPDRKGDYDAASPCRHVDLPQTLLEPVLVKYANSKGWKFNFNSTFVKYGRASPTSMIVSTIKDNTTGETYQIRSKYLFGCDGARSQVMKQLDLPLIKQPGQGLALNVLVEADIAKHIQYRKGNLHWVFTPELEHPPWGWQCIVRMVKPWHEWMFIIFPHPTFRDFSVSPREEDYLKRVREFLGDDSVPVKILDVAKWHVHETVAEQYHDGNIFCLGDAVHRHPPFNGLGSNTCIQDAWNLAWKLAYVERELAAPSLLDTFSVERQPIGAGVIKRANDSFREHVPVWDALGALPDDVEERKRQHAELSAPTEAGKARRKRLQKAVAQTAHEFSGIGIEMNQRYDSRAVYLTDEPDQRPAPPRDAVLEHQISTYPGSRLPHAWLNKPCPVEPISTIDLVADGAFCLLTGIGGDAWRRGALEASRTTGVQVKIYSIGWGQDWIDVYGDWEQRREVEEDGCILVRPDRTVCWRSMSLRDDCVTALSRVLRRVCGWETDGCDM